MKYQKIILRKPFSFFKKDFNLTGVSVLKNSQVPSTMQCLQSDDYAIYTCFT